MMTRCCSIGLHFARWWW